MLRRNSNLDLVIFGLEGTLVDHRDLVVDSYTKVIEAVGMASYAPRFIFNAISRHGTDRLIEALSLGTRQDQLPEINQKVAEGQHIRRAMQAQGYTLPDNKATKSEYAKEPDYQAKDGETLIPYEPVVLFEEAELTIRKLAHVPLKLVIVTDVSRAQYESDLSLCGGEIRPHIDMSVTADEMLGPDNSRMRTAGTLSNLIQAFNVDNSRVAVVSSEPDHLFAASMVHIDQTIGVSHGFATEEQLAEATPNVCASLDEVYELLTKGTPDDGRTIF